MSIASGTGTLEFVTGSGERMRFTLRSADTIIAVLLAAPGSDSRAPEVQMRRID
jgi:hypothetical protein